MSQLELKIAEEEYKLEKLKQELIKKDIEKRKREEEKYIKEKNKWINEKQEKIVNNFEKLCDKGKPIDICCPECAKVKDIGIENHIFREGETPVQITPGRLLIRCYPSSFVTRGRHF